MSENSNIIPMDTHLKTQQHLGGNRNLSTPPTVGQQAAQTSNFGPIRSNNLDALLHHHHVHHNHNLHHHQHMHHHFYHHHLPPVRQPDQLTTRLIQYQYLDDYDWYREKRLRRNAMKKFNHIMQTIKDKQKDEYQFEDDGDPSAGEEDCGDDLHGGGDYSFFEQILKRHRERIKQSLRNQSS